MYNGYMEKEQREEFIRLCVAGGRTIAQLAKRMNVSESKISYWKSQLRRKGVFLGYHRKVGVQQRKFHVMSRVPASTKKHINDWMRNRRREDRLKKAEKKNLR